MVVYLDVGHYVLLHPLLIWVPHSSTCVFHWHLFHDQPNVSFLPTDSSLIEVPGTTTLIPYLRASLSLSTVRPTSSSEYVQSHRHPTNCMPFRPSQHCVGVGTFSHSTSLLLIVYPLSWCHSYSTTHLTSKIKEEQKHDVTNVYRVFCSLPGQDSYRFLSSNRRVSGSENYLLTRVDWKKGYQDPKTYTYIYEYIVVGVIAVWYATKVWLWHDFLTDHLQ